VSERDRWTANPPWTVPARCAGCGELITRDKAGRLRLVRAGAGSPESCPGSEDGRHSVPAP
jgi:hypothetical protein